MRKLSRRHTENLKKNYALFESRRGYCFERNGNNEIC
jgi:hypothetical protein